MLWKYFHGKVILSHFFYNSDDSNLEDNKLGPIKYSCSPLNFFHIFWKHDILLNVQLFLFNVPKLLITLHTVVLWHWHPRVNAPKGKCSVLSMCKCAIVNVTIVNAVYCQCGKNPVYCHPRENAHTYIFRALKFHKWYAFMNNYIFSRM